MSSDAVTDLPAWKALADHKNRIEQTALKDLFERDPGRAGKFKIACEGLSFDYARHRVDAQALNALIALARARGVEDERARLFSGEIMNATENRAALHVALRQNGREAYAARPEILAYVHDTLAQMEKIAGGIRQNPVFTDIIHIGTGGSYLGPRLVCEALQDVTNGPRVHYISTMDGASPARLFKRLNPQTTLAIIASKTFTTAETALNMMAVKEWLGGAMNHVCAITENTKLARDFGVKDDHIVPLKDWIGGRFSLWSGIGLSIAIACGFDHFQKLLDGAAAMDRHFYEAPLAENIPVLMALLGIWYRNFWDCRALAILPYAQNLEYFPAFIQQLDMESNGKSVTRGGRKTAYATGPMIIGGVGTDSQHAFFQFFHQGSDIVPADFIQIETPDHALGDHHRRLNCNLRAQAQALMEGTDDIPAPHSRFPGNRPSSVITLERLDAFHLGLLIAAYEHKIFAQGVIWDINSFDQWGVELGKTLAERLLEQ